MKPNADQLIERIYTWAMMIGDGQNLIVPWPEVMANLREMIRTEYFDKRDVEVAADEEVAVDH